MCTKHVFDKIHAQNTFQEIKNSASANGLTDEVLLGIIMILITIRDAANYNAT